jgi:hypothetical protein
MVLNQYQNMTENYSITSLIFDMRGVLGEYIMPEQNGLDLDLVSLINKINL